LVVENGSKTLSAYSGELTPDNIVLQATKIVKAFPSVSNSFIDLLIERIKDKGFSDRRLNDAVNFVIDNCQYPNPTLANFLSFDKRIKILDYDELCSAVVKQETKFDNYTPIKINGKSFFVRKKDKELYNLPNEI
jgi:hypothetical protein